MEIEFLHICEKTLVSKGGNLSLIEIFDQINAPGFPAFHPVLNIVVGIRGEKNDYALTATIQEEATANIVIQGKAKLSIQTSGAAARFVGKFNGLVFPSPGKYRVIVAVGDKNKELSLTLNLEK